MCVFRCINSLVHYNIHIDIEGRYFFIIENVTMSLADYIQYNRFNNMYVIPDSIY